MAQYRKRKRVETCYSYLHGTARKAHTLRGGLKAAPEERSMDLQVSSSSTSTSTPSASTTSASIAHTECLSCTLILEQLKVNFDRTGRELRHSKRVLPEPRKPDKLHYRNLVAQNQWIRNNLRDALGNYRYCQKCINKVLRIGTQRLAHQRAIKR